MNCNFDAVIERKGTNSLKYDFAAERGKPGDVLPMWVADMDFMTAPAVRSALKGAVDHGVFGYSESTEGYFEAVHGWYEENFGWKIGRDWLIKTPGVVFAICMAIRAFTREGDAVLIQRPVYYPFSESITANGRELVNNPLVCSDGKYGIDFEDFEEKIVRRKVKLFLLCSPHNPVGRVWTKEELLRLGDICLRHGVVVVSDEIHSDFVYEGARHLVFADLSPEFLQNTVTCTSPTKSFNLAGLQISNIFIANPTLRDKFQAEVTRAGYSQVGGMGLVACEAAYRRGRPWLDELRAYLAENLDFLRRYLKKRLPDIKLIEPEGTYLIWTDWRGLGLSGGELESFVVRRAKLWLDRGALFGPEGAGFERFNIACPRGVLEKALNQLADAADAIR